MFASAACRIRGYISGESARKGIPNILRFTCQACGNSDEVTLGKKDLFDRITGLKNPSNFVNLSKLHSTTCIGGEPHFISVMGLDPPLTYHEIAARDVLASDFSDVGVHHPYSSTYLLGEVPLSKEAILHGHLYLNKRRNNAIEFLVEWAEPSEASLEGFAITEQDFVELQQHFGKLTVLDDYCALAQKNNPRIAGRTESKLATLLVWTSATWIHVNGVEKPATLRCFNFGDARTGKGEIGNYIQQRIRLGKHAIGETSSRTGITYTIDSERKMILWGALVEGDRTLVVLEAMHQFPPEDLSTMREAFAKLRVEVRRSVTAEAHARTRVIADANAPKEAGHVPLPLPRSQRSKCFKDSVDVTRWSFFIPFGAEDVSILCDNRCDPEWKRRSRIPQQTKENCSLGLDTKAAGNIFQQRGNRGST